MGEGNIWPNKLQIWRYVWKWDIDYQWIEKSEYVCIFGQLSK